MNRNFPAYQAETIARLQSSMIVSNIRHSQTSKSSFEISKKVTKVNQVRILKYKNNKSDTSSHIRHFNIPNELLDSMEEQILEKCLSMPERDLTTYEDKKL